jgi:pyridoxamine-phosphate oxidase
MDPEHDAIPHGDPLALFDAWLAEAVMSEPNDPNAMAVATTTSGGAPSVRMLLLKGHGPDGFVFYTNAESRKGDEIRANPRAALLFHWKSLHRQVRIEGPLEEVSAAMADAYFASRHPDSRLGSAASDQSRPLDSRKTYLDRVEVCARATRRRGAAPAALDRLPLGPRADRVLALAPAPPARAALFTAAQRAESVNWDAARCWLPPDWPPAAARPLTRSAAFASIAMALFLGLLKGWAVWRTGSTAMLGSLADTALDLVASLATLAGVWVASQPADESHRFGHGKAEALSAMFQVILIVLSGAAIAFRAVIRLAEGGQVEAAEQGIVVSVIAILATFALLAWQRHVIRQTGSLAIRTDNVHYKSDLCSTSRSSPRWSSTSISVSTVPTRCSASLSPAGCCGAPGAPRARRSTT